MNYFESYIRPWVFPTIATAAFLLLLMHKSEFPAVFNRYSMNYAIILILSGLNLGLLWRKAVRRVSYRRLIERLSFGPLLSLLLVVISAIFLLDFLSGIDIGIRLPRSRGDWVAIVLLGVLYLQVEASREQPMVISSHLALFGCSFAVTVILLELIFVVFLLQTRTPKNHREFLQLMAHLEVWPQPISMSKPRGTFRILGLSDSFGLWGGTTSNYHYLVEGMLRHDGVPAIQMVNVSVHAYQPPHQLALLRFAMPYAPDVVLHGFYVGNDFFPNNDDMYTYRGIPTRRQPGDSPYRPRHFLTANWISNVLGRFQFERQRNREQITGLVDELGTYSKEAFLKIQFDRVKEYGRRDEKDVNRMKKTLSVIDAIRSTVEQGGAQYVIVIHPNQTQVDDKLRQDVITRFNVNEDDYDFDLPQKLLRSYCADRGIPCLDLLPIFRAKAKGGDLYSLRDTHYNHTGNELAAASIAQFLHDGKFLLNIHRPHLTRRTQDSKAFSLISAIYAHIFLLPPGYRRPLEIHNYKQSSHSHLKALILT